MKPMKSSGAYSKLAKFSKPAKKDSSSPKPSPDKSLKTEAGEINSQYTKKVIITFMVTHIIFCVVISLWYLHRYVVEPAGIGYIIYLLEWPGALIVSLIGQSENADSAIPYLAAFIINTIYYGFIGYLLGNLSQKYKWHEEVNRLFKMEAEVYEDLKETANSADNP